MTKPFCAIYHSLLGSLETRVTGFHWKYKLVHVSGLVGQPESVKLLIVAYTTLTDCLPCKRGHCRLVAIGVRNPRRPKSQKTPEFTQDTRRDTVHPR
ncbi:hypothetical protein DPMN_137598 [Dreissena polymorpha]|uniref:Uncharacterized protein n=1 Tax=Dreissena polymorpha TaxID=45954 RepID=A0A9D4G860_DREPO|nr:hypothetical protein DPMN_137598 [Dreissena polymorpha]